MEADSNVKLSVRERAFRVRENQPFGLVLIGVFCSFVYGMIAPDGLVSELILLSLQGFTLLLALWVSQVPRKLMRAALLIVALAWVASLVTVLFGSEPDARPLTRIVMGLLVGIAPFSIIRGVVISVRRDRKVSLQAVFGVISVYLLMGMTFAAIYACLASFDNGYFFEQVRTDDLQDYLYFSFVTLTTTGYGDFTAATRAGRTFATIEALIGQLYLVSVLSLFVANLKPKNPVKTDNQ